MVHIKVEEVKKGHVKGGEAGVKKTKGEEVGEVLVKREENDNRSFIYTKRKREWDIIKERK